MCCPWLSENPPKRKRVTASPMSYYDIDDIMAEEQNVPCVLKNDIIKLGHFDPHGTK